MTTDDAHYSTEWAVAEYEPPPSLHIVELEWNHAMALLNAANLHMIAPGTTQVEIDLLSDAVAQLSAQVYYP